MLDPEQVRALAECYEDLLLGLADNTASRTLTERQLSAHTLAGLHCPAERAKVCSASCIHVLESGRQAAAQQLVPSRVPGVSCMTNTHAEKR